MSRSLKEFLALLSELADEDVAFDADVAVGSLDSSRRSVGGRRPSAPPWLDRVRRDDVGDGDADRRDSGSGDDGTLTGREKFAARRRAKRLERLLERADRGDGPELGGRSRPAVDVREDDDRATIVVDAADATATVDETRVTIAAGDHEEVIDLGFAPETVGRTENNGVTTLHIE